MVIRLERKYYYVPLAKEMANALDQIIDETGRKYGIFDKNQLVRQLMGDFIAAYEASKDMKKSKENTVGRIIRTDGVEDIT